MFPGLALFDVWKEELVCALAPRTDLFLLGKPNVGVVEFDLSNLGTNGDAQLKLGTLWKPGRRNGGDEYLISLPAYLNF